MMDPRRPVPAGANISLTIRVTREQLSVRVECDVIRIAQSAADQLPILSVAVSAGDPARW